MSLNIDETTSPTAQRVLTILVNYIDRYKVTDSGAFGFRWPLQTISSENTTFLI